MRLLSEVKYGQITGFSEGDHLPPGHKHLDDVPVITCQARKNIQHWSITVGETGQNTTTTTTTAPTQIQELFQENLKRRRRTKQRQRSASAEKRSRPSRRRLATYFGRVVLEKVDGSARRSHVHPQRVEVFAHFKVARLVVHGQGLHTKRGTCQLLSSYPDFVIIIF